MLSVKELTIKEMHSQLKASTYTCKQLIEAFLERVPKLDRCGPKLNSLLELSSTTLRVISRSWCLPQINV
jgi:Asp-tRNA(Asn)/Glu-tRNA(Gln) amidotransferase A subunit family amidase